MYSKRMMRAGAVLVAAAVAILIAGLFFIGREEDTLKKAARFDGAGPARAGDLVVIEGRVSEKNRILVHDFVDAAQQHNDAGTWLDMETYRQPVIADLARGEIILNAAHICERPEGANVLPTDDRTPNNDPVRFIGLRRGDRITAVGTLAALDPAALAVSEWYNGSFAQYTSAVATNRMTAYIACPIIAAAGAALFFIGYRGRDGSAAGIK